MLTIYGSQNCHWCGEAVRLCEANGLDYNYVDVQSCEQAMQMFRERALRSVPQIFDSGDHIGGYKELQQYIKENQ